MAIFNISNRYRVRYKDIVWKRCIYHVGEIMPIEFTEREVARHINGRRFEVVDPMELTMLAEQEAVRMEQLAKAAAPTPEATVAATKPLAPAQLAKK